MRFNSESLARAASRLRASAWLAGPLLLSIPLLWPVAARAAHGARGNALAQVAVLTADEQMRGGKASYDGALALLRRAKELADYPVLTKSGLIVGLGERNEEVVETMGELRAHGVDVVTIGQYLQPSAKHAKIDRWVHPEEFAWLREQGEALGFGSVFAGPLVRSSYRADEQRHAAATGSGAVSY